MILTPIYEAEFLGFSYGFRPGRGAHDALDALAFGIERRKVSWIVDADLRTYFDTIPRDWLITFLEHRIGEARFWHVSYGFRPGRGCHGALEHIRQTIMPRNKVEADGKRHAAPYQWVIEGDIEGCFDNIDHHLLMHRVRRAVADTRVNRLIVSFLKAGVLEDFIYSPTASGTPQGGVITPRTQKVTFSSIG